MLAQQLSSVPNSISIEGHTDSLPYANDAGYGNWKLSADRANAARRLMQEKGLRHDQVSQVRDYADQRLRSSKNPFDPSNRRITLIVQNLEAPPQSSSADPAKQAAQPAPAEPSPATKSAAAVHVEGHLPRRLPRPGCWPGCIATNRDSSQKPACRRRGLHPHERRMINSTGNTTLLPSSGNSSCLSRSKSRPAATRPTS